jgi:hypothetical protein
MEDLYRPSGWPKTVAPPGTEDWESTAVAWLLELVPYLRDHTTVRRHPVILAVITRHITDGAVEGARKGYRIARTELGQDAPPHAVDAALAAYQAEGRRLAAEARAVGLVERALRDQGLTGSP